MGVKRHRKECGEESTHKDRPLFEHNPRWKGGEVTFPNLNPGENDDQQSKSQETAPDFGIRPGVCGTTPLESEEQTDDGTDEEKCSEEVNLADFLLQREVAMFPVWVLEKEEDCSDCDGADRKVNVETPTPRDA